jgi:glycosyltransferase involved in cell wall biosynthesis
MNHETRNDTALEPPPGGSQRPPTVAVCIPTFNQAEFLEAAVLSALRQDYSGAIEVWVADDASTDDTPSVLERLHAQHARLRSFRQVANVGVAVNTSDLMRGPRTDLLVRLDSDDLLERDYVRRLAVAMARCPLAGYGHTAITEIDEHGRARRIRRVARATGYQSADEALRAAASGYRTAANVLMFRRSALERLSFYDGRPEFVEDYDLSVRMADAGFGNVYVDEPLARYRLWSDAGGARDRRKALQLDGYRRIFDDALTPAWQRRGWSVRPLAARRRRLAIRNCPSCFAPQYSDAEREELVALVRRLSDDPRVRLRLRLCRLGLARALERLDSIPYRAKDLVKAALSRWRHHRRPSEDRNQAR